MPGVSGQSTGPAGWDLIQPFRLEASGFHGRLVRLGPAVDTIIAQHSYPDAVASLLAESVALGSALAAALKYDGVFSLQLSGDGPLRYMICDVTSAGAIRAFAGIRDDFPDDGTLAGAHLDMATAVRNAVAALEVPLSAALHMASRAPAEFLGLGDRLGRIAPGYRANLVLLDERLRVVESWIDGVC